jgi:hypothetical protein
LILLIGLLLLVASGDNGGVGGGASFCNIDMGKK